MVKDCRFKNTQKVKFVAESEGDSSLFYACQSNEKDEACYTSSGCKSDEETKWFLDSGCTNHMTANEAIFQKVEATPNSKVRLGNGALVEVKGKGSIGVQTKRGSMVIHDVLLVPNLD